MFEIETHRWHPEQLVGGFRCFWRDNLFADFARIAIRHPVELGDQFGGPHIGRGVAVALQAEGHIERLFLVDFDHLIDAAVAAHAAHARVTCDRVIKIDVVGKA